MRGLTVTYTTDEVHAIARLLGQIGAALEAGL